MVQFDTKYYDFVTTQGPVGEVKPPANGPWTFVAVSSSGNLVSIVWAKRKPPR